MKPSRQHAEKPVPENAPSEAAPASASPESADSRSKLPEYDFSNFFFGTGDDPFVMVDAFDGWWPNARAAGYYVFAGQRMLTPPGTRVDILEAKNYTKIGLL